jgi:hypothetical protein
MPGACHESGGYLAKHRRGALVTRIWCAHIFLSNENFALETGRRS